MKKTVIAITGNILVETKQPFAGYIRSYVNEDYITSVVNAGGLPYILAIHDRLDLLEQQLSMVDGVIISGGFDVDPVFYGENPHPALGETYPRRDRFELKVIEVALKLNKPIFGICRGLQILNTYFGGTLWQDNQLAGSTMYKHTQSTTYRQETHSVSIDKNSFLATILGENAMVNSYHHQSIQQLGKGLRKIAWANDGIVEAIQADEHDCVFGVQWHPEMLQDNQQQQAIFKYFVDKAGELNGK